MLSRRWKGTLTFAFAFAFMISSPHAQDAAKYPDLRGQWVRSGPVQWDTTKPPARGQQAPLTAEYRAIYETALAEQTHGAHNYNPQVRCVPPAIPRAMIGYEPIEILVTP